MTRPLSLSVIIPTYNGCQLLGKCLRSLAAQEVLPTDVIVVDNGSKDDTEQVISNAPIAVHLIKLPENKGFSRAVNKGILESHSELILVLNNDVTLDKNCIGELKNAARNRHYTSFSPLVFEHNRRHIVHSAGLMFSNKGYGNRSNRVLFSKNSSNTDVFCPCGAIALYRRSALEEGGYFNEDFFMFCEDVEIGLRLQLRGHRCLLVTSAVAYHRGGATAKNFFRMKVEQTLANALSLLITCIPFRWMMLDGLKITCFYSYLILNCFERGYIKEVFQALRIILTRLPKLLICRVALQKNTCYEESYLRNLLYTSAIEINFEERTVTLPPKLIFSRILRKD